MNDGQERTFYIDTVKMMFDMRFEVIGFSKNRFPNILVSDDWSWIKFGKSNINIE